MHRLLLLVLTVLALVCNKKEYIYPDTFHPPWPASEIELKHGTAPYSLTRDLKENRPAVTLLFFGFTHCPDICPATMQRAAEALRGLEPGELAKVRFLFVTVDPDRDSPDIARAYAEKFHPTMMGLSGTAQEVKTVIKSYAVHTSSRDGEISHSGAIYWITPDAKVTKRISQDFTARDLTHDLKIATR